MSSDSTDANAATPFSDLAGDVADSGFGAPSGGFSASPNMIGDSLNGGGIVTHMGTGLSSESAVSLFAFHVFKISEDESPIPRDRVYFDINDYNNAPGTNYITRYMLGLEKTLLDGMVSFGLRLPIWAVDIEPTPVSTPTVAPFGPAGSNSDLGDLTLTLKGILTSTDNSLLSAGLSITTPTGPATIGDVEPYYLFDNVAHRGGIQPWLGYYSALDSPNAGWFTQGFAAFDLPFDRDDADYFYLDISIGNRIQRDRCGWITAISPMVEAHWSAPLGNKHQPFTLTPLGASAVGPNFFGTLAYRNQVNITCAVNMEIMESSSLALGIVVPTVGPRVMDFEWVMQYNAFRF